MRKEQMRMIEHIRNLILDNHKGGSPEKLAETRPVYQELYGFTNDEMTQIYAEVEKDRAILSDQNLSRSGRIFAASIVMPDASPEPAAIPKKDYPWIKFAKPTPAFPGT